VTFNLYPVLHQRYKRARLRIRSATRLIPLIALFAVPALFAQPMPADVSIANLKADEQERDQREKLSEIIQALDLKPGSRIADIGTGYGYFAIRFAPTVGPTGLVFAEEIDKPLVDKLRQRIKTTKQTNITVILGTPDDPKLPPNSLDAILMADVYHEIANPSEMLRNLRKTLKPGGRLLIEDYLKPELRNQSRQQQAKNHNISPEFVEQDLKESGFTVVERRDPFTKGYDNIPMYLLLAR
jgi:predicted methyltransferase